MIAVARRTRGRLGAVIAGASWIVPLALALSACSLPYFPPFTPAPPAGGADLVDAKGRVVGRAVLLQKGSKVRILIDVFGLTPGTRGVHIHSLGRCDQPSFESAGPHFNTGKTEHGAGNPRGPHAGDLPNIVVDPSGRGHLEVTTSRVTLKKGAHSLFDGDGSSLIVHENMDDQRTDPDGDSGARAACGVIMPAG